MSDCKNGLTTDPNPSEEVPATSMEEIHREWLARGYCPILHGIKIKW